MHGRSPVAGLVLAVAALAAAPASASAQVEGTADQAQARSGFPVYEITRQLGLPSFYRVEALQDNAGCDGDAEAVRAQLRRGREVRMGRNWLSMYQGNSRCVGHVSGYRRVRRVMVLGQRVTVRRYCQAPPVDSCAGFPAERVYTMRFSLRAGGQRTFISLSAGRISLRAVLRAVRSLRRVDLSRPVVALTDFRSPDGGIFCMMRDEEPSPYAACIDFDPHRSAYLGPDGTVDLCDQDPLGCIPQFDVSAPRLQAGQSSRFGQFTCAEAAGAITCTVADGEHAGKGFRIDANGVAAVSPG